MMLYIYIYYILHTISKTDQRELVNRHVRHDYQNGETCIATICKNVNSSTIKTIIEKFDYTDSVVLSR